MKPTRARCGQLATLLLLVALAGCNTTPQSSHYLLRAHPGEPSASDEPSVGVGPVIIPEYLKRDTIVLSVGEHKLNILGTQRWAEPLESGISRVLLLDLAELLQTQGLRTYPWHPQRAPDYGVKVRVIQLDASPGAATLVAEWLIYRPNDDSPLARRISSLQEPLSGPTPLAEDVARAYSELLFDLSELIAAVIDEHRQGNAADEG